MSEQNQETEEERKNREAWAVSVQYDYCGTDFKISLGDIYNIVASGTVKPSMKECKIFMKLCESQQLNPFLNEAYLIKFSEHKPAQMVVGKDLFERRADTFPTYDGKKSGVIIKRGVDVIDLEGAFMLKTDELLGGWCTVYRSDRKEPTTIKVTFDEYVGKKSNGQINQQWTDKPLTMIRKVAVAQALREAFTKSFVGLYVQEEVDSAQNPTDKEASTNKSNETKSPLEKIFDTSEAVDGELVNENSVDPHKSADGNLSENCDRGESQDANLNEEIGEVLQEDDRVELVPEGNMFGFGADPKEVDEHEESRNGSQSEFDKALDAFNQPEEKKD